VRISGVKAKAESGYIKKINRAHGVEAEQSPEKKIWFSLTHTTTVCFRDRADSRAPGGDSVLEDHRSSHYFTAAAVQQWTTKKIVL